jgi:hypothetical protein
VLEDEDQLNEVVQADVDLFDLFLRYHSEFLVVVLAAEIDQLIFGHFTTNEFALVVSEDGQLGDLLIDEVADSRPDGEIPLAKNVVPSVQDDLVLDAIQNHLNPKLVLSEVKRDSAAVGLPNPKLHKLQIEAALDSQDVLKMPLAFLQACRKLDDFLLVHLLH